MLYGLKKPKLLGETLLLSIFLHQKVRQNQKITRRLSFETAQEFLTCLLTLTLEFNPYAPSATYVQFSGVYQFQPFLGHCLLLLKLKTKLITFCIEFQVREVKVLPSRTTSLLLYSKRVQRNCTRFFKSFKKQCMLYQLRKQNYVEKHFCCQSFCIGK